MSRLKVMSVFGTRPEAIKMAPLVLELERRPQLESVVCVTAQHREMLDSVLREFGITPEHDLNIMKSGQSLADITSRVLQGLGPVFEAEKPGLVLVHGDTTTAFAASLAGSGRMTRQYTHSMYSAKEYTIRMRRLNTEPYLR